MLHKFLGNWAAGGVLVRATMVCLCLAVIWPAMFCDTASAQLLGNRDAAAANEPDDEEIWLPGPVRTLIGWTARQQVAFNRVIEREVMAYRSEGSIAGALTLIMVSFLYGVFHAVGPGHGKAVVSSYFLAREAVVWRGLALGGTIAFIQAISAILIVTVLGWLLEGRRLAILDNMAAVEAVSYGLVVLLGLYMSWASLTGRDCGHDHSGLNHDCGDSHHHSHHHGHGALKHTGNRFEFLGAAFVSGLRPCTGALIVLFFALANGILLVGAIATFAMALGVAITISAVGIVAILTRRGLLRLSETKVVGGAAGGMIARGLSVAGSLLVLAIGTVLLLGAFQRGGLLV